MGNSFSSQDRYDHFDTAPYILILYGKEASISSTAKDI